MALHEIEAKGKIILSYKYWESEYGYAKTIWGAELYAIDNNIIVLETYDERWDLLRNGSFKVPHKYFEMDVQELIKLIEKNGIPTDVKAVMR